LTGPLVGIDLGGTSIRAAVATGASGHGATVHRDTPAADGPEAVLDACAEAAREAGGGTPLVGAAIGSPGPLDAATGVVNATPHLRGWEGVNARAMLSERLDCPVAIQNDASLAGYAEWSRGVGRGSSTFVFITVSTGIGGALVMDGALQHGATGTAGEVGHVPAATGGARCGQGHPGCLEGIASGTAMARRAQEAIRAGVATSLSSVPADAIDAVEIERAAQGGDALANEIFRDAGRALGRALGGLINLLNPEIISIGGGLINSGELLFAPLHAGVREIAFAAPLATCRITKVELGTDAGLVGAVAWAVKEFGQV